jgi:Tol biopolymer transport system component
VARGIRVTIALVLACLGLAACHGSPAEGPPGTVASSTANLVAVSSLSESIWLVDPVTGFQRRLIEGLVDYQAGFATWAPDHRRLAFGDDGIEIVDARDGQQTLLNQGTSLSMPTWSPDGSRLAYGDGSSLWITPVGHIQPLPMLLPTTLAPISPSWGPGDVLAFQGLELRCGKSGCVSTDRSEIWTVRPDGSDLWRLTSVGHAEHPKWSPGGSKILFVRTVPVGQSAKSELWVVGSDGSSSRRLLPVSDVVAADWSPDGGRIAILRPADVPGTLQLWVANGDGSDLHAVGRPIEGTAGTVDW